MTDLILSKKASSVNPSSLEPWVILFRLAEAAKERDLYSLFWELRREGLRRQLEWWKAQNPEGK